MWSWAAEHLFAPALGIVGGSLAGYGMAIFRFRKGVDDTVRNVEAKLSGTERGLIQRFEELRSGLAAGLHLEVELLKQKVDGEIERVRGIERDVRDVREKSGDYTKEAEFSQLQERVIRWMNETSETLGRVRQFLRVWNEEAKKTLPPPKG